MIAVMRLFELAYCCRIYAEGTGYDRALARFLAGTGGAVDLEIPEHRALTLQWLRDWGCRSLRTEDDQRSSSALKAWWAKWNRVLPAVDATLSTLDDDVLDAAADAYADLATRAGPRRQLRHRVIDIHFGPTTAAKAMFAVRPNAFLPWDDAIRKQLGYKTDAASYKQALTRARDELREAVQDAHVEPSDLPRLIGRPDSTPPKLVDEHDWVRYTLGTNPPTRDELEQWLSWA
jgi:hypothetical protein